MRVLVGLLLVVLLAPSVAVGQEAPHPLKPKELRAAVFALPADDSAVAYARDLRLEGRIVVGSAIGFAGGMLGAALGESLGAPSGRRAGPALVGVGLGVALGMAVVGLPPLLDGQRFLSWYATHPRPPTRLARLKLLHRWRMASLASRRIGAGIGAAFLGATTGIVGAVWASRDVSGVNSSGATYEPTDAVVTAGMGLGLAGALVTLAIADQELRAETLHPHRIYRVPAAPVGLVVPVPAASPDGLTFGLAASLTGRF